MENYHFYLFSKKAQFLKEKTLQRLIISCNMPSILIGQDFIFMLYVLSKNNDKLVRNGNQILCAIIKTVLSKFMKHSHYNAV